MGPTADPATPAVPRLLAVVGLAVAILAIGGFSVRTLVVGAELTPAAVSGSSTAGAPGPPAAAGSGPATAPASAVGDGPAVTDASGRALPGEAAAGVRAVFAALQRGGLAALRPNYAPDPAVGAADWPEVADALDTAGARDQLLAALQSPPQQSSAVAYLYDEAGSRVGIDATGRVAFVLVG